MATERFLALLGMHDAGKTTYLGRLWLAVHAKVGRLHASGLPEELRPLREVSNFLLRSEYPAHTRRGEVTAFNVPLQWSGRKHALTFTLSFTDYSGEELERLFTDRAAAWSAAWERRATGSVGILLFLRPSNIRRPMSTRLPDPPAAEGDGRHWDHLRGEGAEEPEQQQPGHATSADDAAAIFDEAFLPQEVEASKAPSEPHEPIHPPTAVAIVEVLQFLRHQRGLALGEEPDPDAFRVAVAVSCWDGVPEESRRQGPAPFVERHFPLLHDFLSTNFQSEGVRFFGVSSTGGDLGEPTFRQRYDESDPEQMGDVAYHPLPEGSPSTVPDITLPLGWLLEGEGALPDRPDR
jgi:Double-GTPase 1